MKTITCSLLMTGLLAGLAGCTRGPVPLGPNPDEAYSIRLLTSKEAYYEYEPLQLLLRVQNLSEKTKIMPFGPQEAVIHARQPDDDLLNRRSFGMAQQLEQPKLWPNQMLLIPLVDHAGGAYLKREGEWRLAYQCYGSIGRNDLYTTNEELVVYCVRQPLVLPSGTPAAVKSLLEELSTAPVPDIIYLPPSITRVPYNQPMQQLRRLGDAAAEVLVANLGNYRMRSQIVQILGDLRAKPAVPKLLHLLQLKDTPGDHLILAALANITGLSEGEEFQKNWSDPAKRPAAVDAYRDWWQNNSGQ